MTSISILDTAFDGASSADLELLRGRIEQELSNRRILANAAKNAENLQRQVLAAEGKTEGGEWTQPAGGHDAYPKGWKITHGGKTWVSLIASNVWEPGIAGSETLWGLVDTPEPGTGKIQEWEPGRTYQAGTQVKHDGKTFTVLQPHISQLDWVPISVPSLYEEKNR